MNLNKSKWTEIKIIIIFKHLFQCVQLVTYFSSISQYSSNQRSNLGIALDNAWRTSLSCARTILGSSALTMASISGRSTLMPQQGQRDQPARPACRPPRCQWAKAIP